MARAFAKRRRRGYAPFVDLALARLIELATRVVGALPIDRTLALAAGLGRVLAASAGRRTRRADEALARAFPELPPPARARLRREVFAHLARGLVELLILRGRRRCELLERVELAGLEQLEAAARRSPSGGVLVVTAHLGNWELACARVAAAGIPIAVVYRGLRQPALDRALFALRDQAGRVAGGVPVEQIRMGRAGMPVVRALEAGRHVLVLLDQNADREEGVFVEFFGQLACTRAGPIALAMARGVPVVPAFIRRLDDGRRHRIEIGSALELEPGSGTASVDEARLGRNVQRATKAIEEAIRRDPAQWIWLHRRWRTRPAPPETR